MRARFGEFARTEGSTLDDFFFPPSILNYPLFVAPMSQGGGGVFGTFWGAMGLFSDVYPAYSRD